MNDPRSIRAVLGFGHFLFFSSLFFAGGIHSQTQETFLGAPLIAWPYFSQSFVQGLLYLMGLIALSVVIDGWRGGESRWSVFALIAIVLAELYLVTLDFRLAGRFWWLLLVFTIAGLRPREQVLRVLSFAVPASGFWGAGSLLFTPLMVRYNRSLLGILMLFLGFQGLHDPELDTTIFAWTLMVTLFSKKYEAGSVRSLLLSAALVLFVAAGSWSLWKPITVDISFEYESVEHQLSIRRVDREVEILADGEKLVGPWYIDDQLFANPYYFEVHPQRLGSTHLFEIYGEELQRRFGVKAVVNRQGEP